MARVPLTADSECPYCGGSGVVERAVYVPTESLRVGGRNYVPRERKLCRCVGTGEVEARSRGVSDD